jgi:hypothetical protein
VGESPSAKSALRPRPLGRRSRASTKTCRPSVATSRTANEASSSSSRSKRARFGSERQSEPASITTTLPSFVTNERASSLPLQRLGQR